MIRLSEGTKSWFFGCHSAVHSWYVIKAWKHLYGEWPKFWQIVCILLHDIGYCGKDYLTTKSNAGHAERGAYIAGALFGTKGYLLVAGHSRRAASKWGLPLSELEAPDDYSWILASMTWLKTNYIVEPNLGCTAEEWQDAVKTNWKKNGFHGRGSSFGITENFINREK